MAGIWVVNKRRPSTNSWPEIQAVAVDSHAEWFGWAPFIAPASRTECAGAARSGARARAENRAVLAAGALVLGASEGRSLPRAGIMRLVRWEYWFLAAAVTLKKTSSFELLRFHHIVWVKEYRDGQGVVLILFWAVLHISLECNWEHRN